MLEKLKSLGESAKGILIFIVTPILFALGYIYYLLSKDRALEQKIEQMEANDHIEETMNQLKEAQHASTDAQADYDRVKSEFIKQSGDGSGQGNVQ